MKTCPSCDRQNPDGSDFCTCGDYLRWEPTRHVRAVTPALKALGRTPDHAGVLPADHRMMAVPRISKPSAPARAALVLRLPGPDDAIPGARTVCVSPGERVKLVGIVRNESTVVDHYELSVRGLPQGWWTVSPATVYLVPFDSRDDYEQEVEIQLHPPRVAEAHAKDWPIEVVAVSRASGTEVASARAAVRIEPYQDLAAKIVPDRASGRFKSRFAVTLRNRANAPVEVRLDGRDAEGECRFRFAVPSATLAAGKGIEAPVTVLPPKQIWLGRPKDRVITVTATPAGAEQTQQALAATFRQRAWLPWWLSLVAPLAAALAAVALLLLPKQVVVPNLKHARSVFAAEKLAIKSGLRLSPQVTQIQSNAAKPGSIVDQAPDPGTKVKRGSTVQVAVAIGTDMTKVPDVIRSTPVAADATLRTAHLVLGAVSPQPPNPNGSIAQQIPAAGAEVMEGTSVNVFLKTTTSGHHSSKIVLPVVAGTVAAAAQQLSALGLVPTIVRQLSSQPAGQLVGTNPPSGSPLPRGTGVQLIESAGYPEITYDDGSRVHVVGGASGHPAGTNPPGKDTEEAAWSPDGNEIAYVEGASPSSGQLMLFAPGQSGAQPAALTGSGSNVRDPAFAPNGQILAFIDRSQGYGRLCFATVSTSTAINTSDCTSHPGYDLGGQISWSRDGKSVLVFGVEQADSSQHGLIEFRTTTPFSPNASAWDQGSLATQPSQDVIAGGFSPDGKHVALISDFNQSTFHLFIAPANVFDVSKATMYSVEACQVSWRSDSQAVAVMQSTNGCTPDASGAYPLGNIVMVALADPTQTTIVGSNAENPSWQPLSLTG